MDNDEAIRILNDQLIKIEKFEAFSKPFTRDQQVAYTTWKNDVESTLDELFGKESSFYKGFTGVGAWGIIVPESDYEFHNKEFQDGLTNYQSVLNSAINKIKTFGIGNKRENIDVRSKQPQISVNTTVVNNIGISLDTRQTFNQILSNINSIQLSIEEREILTRNVKEFENEIKKEKPDNRKLLDCIKKVFAISKDIGLALLPYMIEHWDKLFK